VLGIYEHRRLRCNLASLNLLRFVHSDGEFDVWNVSRAVGIVFNP